MKLLEMLAKWRSHRTPVAPVIDYARPDLYGGLYTDGAPMTDRRDWNAPTAQDYWRPDRRNLRQW